MFSNVALSFLLAAAAVRAQVTASGPNGPTNPSAPSLNTPLNQSSYSRLATLNSFDDFCLFAPPQYVGQTTTASDGSVLYESTIGNTEQIEVAWCTKPRNNARLIPDGVIKAVHFVKTPLYVQIRGYGDLTQLNIPYGDEGGELDPHGATGLGNPIGGNVTSDVSGSDVFYEEWMMFVSYSQFCFRICTSENSTYSAALECQHQIDELGCDWVMPGDTDQSSFTSCDADSAYPPGVYPLPDGGASTFAQYFASFYIDNGQTISYTVGQTVTPAAAASTPASSNCNTYSTLSNGVASISATNPAIPTGTGGGAVIGGNAVDSTAGRESNSVQGLSAPNGSGGAQGTAGAQAAGGTQGAGAGKSVASAGKTGSSGGTASPNAAGSSSASSATSHISSLPYIAMTMAIGLIAGVALLV